MVVEAACAVDNALHYLATQDKSAVKLKITPKDEGGQAVAYALVAWNLPEGSVLTDEKGEPITLGSKFRCGEHTWSYQPSTVGLHA